MEDGNSLCRRWFIWGNNNDGQDNNDGSPDNCVTCRRIVILMRMKEEGAKSGDSGSGEERPVDTGGGVPV